MLSLNRQLSAGRCFMAVGCWCWFFFLHAAPVWPELSGDPLFSDGFEVNNPSFPAWDEDSGNLQVAGPPAPVTGNYSMAAVITNQDPRYVRDILPAAESRYRARFWFDVNSLTMADGDQHLILQGVDATGLSWDIPLRFSNGNYYLQLGIIDDAQSLLETPWFKITDDLHTLEMEWAAATVPGATNGFGILWIDGTAKALLQGIDNDTRRTESVYLGPSLGLDPGTSGTLYFDAFESARPPVREAILAEKSVRLEEDLNRNGLLNPGDSVTYTNTLANVGPHDLSTLQLLDTLDDNTVQVPGTVHTTPLAFNDNYPCLGNVGLDVPAAEGLLANDADLENQLLAGPPPLHTGLTVAAFDVLSAHGGDVSAGADGGFTYVPPAGYEGEDTFSYTIQDPDGNRDRGVVTIQVAGMIWFIDNRAGTAGDGRLGSPFNTLAGFVSQAADKEGDIIYLYSGSGDYPGGITLLNNQQLIGQGVDLATGAGITLPAYSRALPSAGTNPVITNAAGNCITLAQNNTLRGLTAGAASGWGIQGTNAGTVTASGIRISGPGGGLNLQTATLAMTLDEITCPNLTREGIRLVGVSGSVNSASTTLIDPQGTGILVQNSPGASLSFGATTISDTASGSGNSGNAIDLATGNAGANCTFTSLAVNTDRGIGILANNSGTVHIGGVNNTIQADQRAAVDVTSTSLGSGWTLANVSSAGSTGNGVQLVSVSGSFTATGGSITNAAQTGFRISGGSSAVTYQGNISTAANRLIDIQNRTGGSVTYQTGTLSATGGTGILAQNNSGGTITFGGPVSLITGANGAATLSSNTGAAVTFSGGLNITTTSGYGLQASGGGTLTVSGTTNDIATGTGVSLSVQNTTFGAGDLNFRRISANGADQGIVLNNTGTLGGLKVGANLPGSPAVGDGGVLQNLTQNALSLTNTANISLNYLRIQGTGSHAIVGVGVTDQSGNTEPSLEIRHCGIVNAGNSDDENALHFVGNPGITGRLAISDTTITAYTENALEIDNSSGALRIDISNSTINDNHDTFGADAIFVESQGTASITLNLTGSTFDNTEGAIVQFQDTGTGVNDVNITGNTSLHGGGPDLFPAGGGIILAVNNTGGTLTFDIQNNDITSLFGDGVVLVGKGNLEGRITDNSISGTGGDGVRVDMDQGAGNYAWNVLIQNNQFGTAAGSLGIGDDGIQVLNRDGQGTLNLTIENNLIANTASEGIRIFTDEDLGLGAGNPISRIRIANNTLNSIGAAEAIYILTRDTADGCFHISGNGGNAGGAPDGSIALDQLNTSILRITQASSAGLSTANNGAVVSLAGTITFNGSCTNPTLPSNP